MRIALSAIAFALITPTHAYASDPYYDALNPQSSTKMSPQLNERKVVSAGEPIILREDVRIVEGAFAEQDFYPPEQISNKLSVKKGDGFFRVSSKSKLKVCSLKLGTFGQSICLLDDDGDGNFDRVSSNSVLKAHPIQSPLPYKSGFVNLPLVSSGMKMLVLYQGVSSGSLLFSYREFRDDYARPAFEENISIPLGKTFPQKIALKGAIFVIHGVDGLGVDYEIEKSGVFATGL